MEQFYFLNGNNDVRKKEYVNTFKINLNIISMIRDVNAVVCTNNKLLNRMGNIQIQMAEYMNIERVWWIYINKMADIKNKMADLVFLYSYESEEEGVVLSAV